MGLAKLLRAGEKGLEVHTPPGTTGFGDQYLSIPGTDFLTPTCL